MTTSNESLVKLAQQGKVSEFKSQALEQLVGKAKVQLHMAKVQVADQVFNARETAE